jgi:hypothetical protein
MFESSPSKVSDDVAGIAIVRSTQLSVEVIVAVMEAPRLIEVFEAPEGSANVPPLIVILLAVVLFRNVSEAG